MCVFFLGFSPPPWTSLVFPKQRAKEHQEAQFSWASGNNRQVSATARGTGGWETFHWPLAAETPAGAPAHSRRETAGRHSAPARHVIERGCPCNRLLTCHGACSATKAAGCQRPVSRALPGSHSLKCPGVTAALAGQGGRSSRQQDRDYRRSRENSIGNPDLFCSESCLTSGLQNKQ